MKKKIIKILKKIISYIKYNTLMIVFIISSLINSILVRYFTIGNIFSLKPLLTDFLFLLLISYIGGLIKPKNQFKYYITWGIILSLICLIHTVYYSNYISFASVSFLSTATELGGYTNALFENILEIKDFIFLFEIFALIFVNRQLKIKNGYNKFSSFKKLGLVKNVIIFLVIISLFSFSLITKGLNRLNQQWNRASIVRDFGIYVYQANDIVSSLKTRVNVIFGYDSAYKTFREYYDNKEYKKQNNKYSNIFEGKNVIVIHGESLQSFTMNLKFNGKVLTPNLNKLAREGIYFNNFYSQESVGNSSDSEFTSLSSLLPSSSGTVFMNYFDRNYETILKLLKDKDYYTFSMHANNGSAWNRNITYKSLGYDKFYAYTNDYEIDEVIGLGLSDKSFFRQSVEKIKQINEEHKNFYGTLVMLSNHTPFSDLEKFDYDLSYKTGIIDEETNEEIIDPWLEGTRIGNYLKSVHYADEAIGELIEELDEAGILDNTIIVLYGDHDCKLKQSEFKKLYESEHYKDVLINPYDTVGIIDNFTYEINRKVPFFIWSKDLLNTNKNVKVDTVMGMIDIMPTLSNMLGVKPKYALGNDMFSIKNNIVVFPSGNWITNKMYYNSSKNEFRQLDLDSSIDINYIDKNNKYAEELINLSNGIITYDLIKAYETGTEVLIEKN